MKSKVISRTNRERLSAILTVFACRDELLPIQRLYIEASDTLLPVHEKICADFTSLPVLARNFLRVVDVEVDLENDTRHNLREVFERVSPFYGDDERQAVLGLDPDTLVIDANRYTTFGWDIPNVYDDNVEYDWTTERVWRDLQLATTRAMAFSRNYHTTSKLPQEYVDTELSEYHEAINDTISKCRSIATLQEALTSTMRSLRIELEQNIEGAKTTKNLVSAWPEVEPFVAKLYPECTDTGTANTCETPIGNIILRHVGALPSPSQAAE